MDPLTIVMLGVLALLIFFMFRNSRKRKQELETLQEKMVPGAEVMTNFGLFGTLVSIDDDANVAVIETSPGSTVRVHRQTLARVIEDEVIDEVAEAEMVAEGAPVVTEPSVNESSVDAPAEKPKRTRKTES
ncbi:preprotein translocase subunit YajC [Microcella sp.]|uniref:preprotein translocase subunit YajC n=1 Tax=Microcella sp. TaxID=1913979 RepID=UPI003F71F1AA